MRGATIQRMHRKSCSDRIAAHHRRQGLGNGDVRGIGRVPFAVHVVLVDLGLKGLFHLPGGPLNSKVRRPSATPFTRKPRS